MKTDEAVRADVIEELALDPELDSSETSVAVHDGTVELRGVVPTYAQRMEAERAACRVGGVCAVKNELEVKLLDSSSRRDAEIEKAANDALIWSVSVPDGDVRVQVRDGWVTLSGEVDWEYQRAAAERAVRNLVGVRGLTNAVQLKAKVTPENVEETIDRALVRNAEVDARRIKVRAKGNEVTVQGKVRTWLEHDEALRADWSIRGVTAVHDNLAVVP